MNPTAGTYSAEKMEPYAGSVLNHFCFSVHRSEEEVWSGCLLFHSTRPNHYSNLWLGPGSMTATETKGKGKGNSQDAGGESCSGHWRTGIDEKCSMESMRPSYLQQIIFLQLHLTAATFCPCPH